MIQSEYQKYIEDHHSTYESCYRQCAPASKEMQRRFPELQIVRGHVETLGGWISHWWLKTEEGEIVDPTAKQFRGILGYEEWVPGEEIQVGRCMNCGDEIWRSVQNLEITKQECICSDSCAKSFEMYLNSEILGNG